MTLRELPSQDVLHELLDYEPETGLLTWRERSVEHFNSELTCRLWNGQHAGKLAFQVWHSQGYLTGRIFGKGYLAHRVIWKWMTGEEPNEVDHDNHIKNDNRWDNLRATDRLGNSKNMPLNSRNKSGHNGIHWCQASGKWCAQITAARKTTTLGRFKHLEDAVAARKRAERLRRFHPNHGILT